MSSKRRLPQVSPALAGMLISAGATLFVAITAFRLAYAGSKGAAEDAGLNESDASWYPLCIEGALVVAAVGTVTVGGFYPWAMLLGFTALSVVANVAHTYDHDHHWDWFHVGVAAVPPCALPLCVHLAIAAAKHYYAHRRAQTPVAVEVATGTGTQPRGATGPEEDAPPALPPASSGPADSTESAPLPTRGAVGSERPASHGPASPDPAHKLVPAPAPLAGAGTTGSASADAAPDADADTAETAAVVHLLPASSRSADAPRTASATASRRGPRRGASAAASASRLSRVTASAEAPGTASDLPDPVLVDAVRAHLRMHGKLPSGRGLAKQMRVHQSKAAAAITHVRDEPEVTS